MCKWWQKLRGKRQLIRWYAGLRQNDRRRYDAMIKAFTEACNISSFPVRLTKKAATARQPYEAYLTSKADHYCITISVEGVLGDYSVTHECLHVALNEEGYVWARVDDDPDLFESRSEYESVIGAISNSLHHPEIYRRMTGFYGAGMAQYWTREIDRGVTKIDKWAERGRRPDQRQFDIIAVLFTFFVPELAEVAERYRARFPNEAEVCDRIVAGAAPVDTGSKEGVRRIAESLRRELVKYCDNPTLRFYSILWAGMQIGPMSSFPDLRSSVPCECG